MSDWMDDLVVVRSSPADERDIRRWMIAAGQTHECRYNHGLVTSRHYAMPLFAGPCIDCGAEL